MAKKKEQSEQELAVITFKRNSLLKKISNLHKLSVELDDDLSCSDEFEVRFSELKATYEAFNRCQNELIKLTVILNPTADLSSQQETIDEVDRQYYAILSAQRKFFNQSNLSSRSVESSESLQPQVKLPKIKLPSFNGHIKDWPHFKDLFTSLVHANNTISPIEKFQYLLSCLSDEPHNLARTLPITAQNYATVWEQLVSRYDDTRRLTTYYLDEIFNLPPITNESPKKLRNMLDVCSENITALNAIAFPVDLGDFMLFHSIVQKLDKRSRQCFETKYASTDFPTVENLLGFLRDHCKALDAAQVTEKCNTLTQPSTQTSNFKHFLRTTNNKPQNAAHVSSLSSNKCFYCNEGHNIYACPNFSALTIEKRKEAVKSKQACFNCLSTGHMLNQCTSSSTCRSCGKRHHTFLHFEPSDLPFKFPASVTAKTTAQVKQILPNSSKPPSNPPLISSVSSGKLRSSTTTVLLGTATIQISDNANNFHTVRALLDPGSQASFITDSCVRRLCLPRNKFTETVSGISQAPVTTTKGMVSCIIKPKHTNGPILNANTIVLPQITNSMPAEHLDSSIKTYFHKYNLADPFFDVPGKIDVLLGADLYPDIFDGGRQSTLEGMPTLFHSIFGWILIGPAGLPNPKSTKISSNLAISDSLTLESCMKSFWDIEEPPKPANVLSPQDKQCEDLFVNTHSRDSTGRYVVRLPFKEDKFWLGNSYDSAEKCLLQLEKRFMKNPSLQVQYTDFMNEYETLGHMRKAKPSDFPPKYYIPHHAVFKNDLESSKIRVVFNASAKTSKGVSLNDQLLVGPKLQNDIFHIISRFRLSPVVFATDICKMYRQILIDEDDQSYQAILWRPSSDVPISTYILQTITYGMTPAPFLALRTLHQLAQDESERFPEATKVLVRDSYVDDIIVGCDSLESAQTLKADLINLLQCGGFELKKWSSNHPELMSNVIPKTQEISICSDPQDLRPVKVLGIKWLPSTDNFTYNVSIENCSPTKRNILSKIAQIFDPLGWVTPIVLWAKSLMQQLWLTGVGWDEVPNEKLCCQWLQFIEELPLLQSLNIPRFAVLPTIKQVELHGFSDASNQGFSAVLYLRSEDEHGLVSVHLVAAKSRVAPVKPMTIPRLELSGALLLARLIKSYNDAIECKFPSLSVFAWCDSLVTLSWINTPPYQLKTFISNRVNEIQECTDSSIWRFTPTLTNPADCASRGLLPQELLEHPLWWHGPKWLHQEKTNWPDQPTSHLPLNKLPEVKSSILSAVVTELDKTPPFDEILLRFSNLSRLKRVTAYVLRFLHNCKVQGEEKRKGTLSTNELNDALMIWVKLIQKTNFSNDIDCIKKKTVCSQAVQRLDPYLDETGVLRVGGRLRYSELKFGSRHPILLPKAGHFIDLIIDHYHISYFHVGPRTLQSFLQQNFWILSIRSAIHKRLFRCVKCARFKAKTPQPFMSDLPAVRARQARPFISVGVDFGGPFNIKTDRLRKPQIRKAYLCLFVCMCTKALHLEVVSDLTIEAFLAAFQRFISRRGLCSDVYTDRGTTFVGANNELQALLHHPKSLDKIKDNLSTKGITWHFNPPYAPNFGGIWESGIKSCKYHMKRVIGEQILTFEELTTLFTSIEAILNSRPLCCLSSDPNEIDVLTPGHFLIGESLINLPYPAVTHLPVNRLSRWQLLQQMKQHFWNRWSLEYLHSLQQRFKWNNRTSLPAIEQGDLVLIKDLNLPPQTWKMGRVETTLPGPDNIVRVAKIRTVQGVITRPVSKLCKLPILD